MSGDRPAMDPAKFARMVAEAGDEQLAAGMSVNRELLLGEIFRQMPSSFDAHAAAGVEAVVEWRIAEAAGGGEDRWQVSIGEGGCRVERDGDESADVVFRVGPVDFLRLVTGGADGPQLFTFGRLRVEGDLLLAARFPALFRVPGA